MDDQKLMARLHKDEEQWYSLLIDRYAPYVAAVVGGIAKGALTASDLEEVAADVFFKVWRKREELRPDSVKGFIARIARTTTIDRLRAKGMEFLPYEDDVIPIPRRDQPDELAIVREQTRIVEAAVDCFGEPEREIFIRFYYFGETIQVIAKRLRLNAATAKTKLHRTRGRLREIMAERGYGCE